VVSKKQKITFNLSKNTLSLVYKNEELFTHPHPHPHPHTHTHTHTHDHDNYYDHDRDDDDDGTRFGSVVVLYEFFLLYKRLYTRGNFPERETNEEDYFQIRISFLGVCDTPKLSNPKKFSYSKE
jgi:hypothetical protein